MLEGKGEKKSKDEEWSIPRLRVGVFLHTCPKVMESQQGFSKLPEPVCQEQIGGNSKNSQKITKRKRTETYKCDRKEKNFRYEKGQV